MVSLSHTSVLIKSSLDNTFSVLSQTLSFILFNIGRLRFFQIFKFCFFFLLMIPFLTYFSLAFYYSSQEKPSLYFNNFAQKLPQLNIQCHLLQGQPSTKLQNTYTIQPSFLPLYNNDCLSSRFQKHSSHFHLRSHQNGLYHVYFYQHPVQDYLDISFKEYYLEYSFSKLFFFFLVSHKPHSSIHGNVHFSSMNLKTLPTSSHYPKILLFLDLFYSSTSLLSTNFSLSTFGVLQQNTIE